MVETGLQKHTSQKFVSMSICRKQAAGRLFDKLPPAACKMWQHFLLVQTKTKLKIRLDHGKEEIKKN
jgi:hypothetical protein